MITPVRKIVATLPALVLCALLAVGQSVWLTDLARAQAAGKKIAADAAAKTAAAKKAAAARVGAAKVGKAIRLLKSGKIAAATSLLNKVIVAGGLSSRDMARALHYRGVALRKQNRPAEAIADFTNALWLKNGLSGALRAEAEAERSAAYKDAGQAKAAAVTQAKSGKRKSSKVRKARKAKKPAVAGGTSGWQVQTRASSPVRSSPASGSKPGASSGGGIAGFFANLFSGGSKKSGSASKVAPASQAPANSGTRISSWNSATIIRGKNTARSSGRKRSARKGSPRTARKKVSNSRKPVARSTASKPKSKLVVAARSTTTKSRYRLILSPIRSVEQARANAYAAQQKFGAVLSGHQPVIESTKFGGHTFYQVRFGPFDNLSVPQKVCTQLKAGGVDCILSRL